MSKKPVYAFCDIGGTKTRVGVSLDGETLSDATWFETPDSFKVGMKKIFATWETQLGEAAVF
jgi:predicted NBD/HSP70 family sugar kinase